MNKVYDKTEFLKYMNKRAKELYSSSELNYWDCYYALQTMNRCIAEILENGDSVNIYKYWDIKPKLFKSVKRYSPLLGKLFDVDMRTVRRYLIKACEKLGYRGIRTYHFRKLYYGIKCVR